MLKVFLDTNVLIDVVARRKDFYIPSSNIINLGIVGQLALNVSPLSYATCVFIARKVLGYEGVIKVLRMLDEFISVTDMNSHQSHAALFSDMPDFEDMLQYESAKDAACDVIVTRNKKHFPQDGIPVLTPTEFLTGFAIEKSNV